MGVKTFHNATIPVDKIAIDQWEVYDQLLPSSISKKESLRALVNWMKQNGLTRLVTKTRILIAPGYTFKMINGLVTNFHQPESTLLLLIAAVVGDKWKPVYDYALQNDFRFLSYGDACLFFIEKAI